MCLLTSMVRQFDIMKLERIYVDANVLINYCTGQPDDYNELRRLFSSKCGAELYTSNLAIVQVIAKLQSKTRDREAFSPEEIKKHIKYFYSHFNVYEVKNQDIKTALEIPFNKDLEDNIHFVVFLNTKCNAILTNNKKDFFHFGVSIRTPRKIKKRKNKGTTKQNQH